MLFQSTAFLIFAPIVLLGHALLGGRSLRVWLLVASYIFYGWAVPWYCILLFATSVVDYNMARAIARTEDPRRRKFWLAVSVTVGLTLLGTFKYADFFIQNLNNIFPVLGSDTRLPTLGLPLPVGISFYTFQSLSYTIDVYRRQMRPAKDFLTFALYVAFFPQLVAGPIERARSLLPQIEEKPTRKTEDILQGTSRILWGLMKKIVFADWLALYVDSVYSRVDGATGVEILLATYAFAFQIYLDFSAYSDIAIGLARFMGIRLMENFKWPYLSPNMGDFWRRWHISLSTWIRDYLYYPLGGARSGMGRTVVNLAIVMFLGGLWHGAKWNYIAWGVWIGLCFALFYGYRRLVPVSDGPPSRIRQAVGVFVTFHAILMSWVLFRSAQLAPDALMAFRSIAVLKGGFNLAVTTPFEAQRALALVVVAMVAHFVRLGRLVHFTKRPVHCGVFWACLVAMIAIFRAPFVRNFIYFQF